MAKRKPGRIKLLTHSRPGEPPRKQTGRLRASIAYEVDDKNLLARVGTNVVYGKFLELGTRHMSSRPFLRRALHEERAMLARILSGRSS